jgi:hypothetical protein
MTRQDVAASCQRASLARLKERRPKRKTWPDGLKLGRDGGAGYNFQTSTVRTMAREVYELMAADPVLASFKDRFEFPEGFPGADFLGQDVTYFRMWITADVCEQADLPLDGDAA